MFSLLLRCLELFSQCSVILGLGSGMQLISIKSKSAARYRGQFDYRCSLQVLSPCSSMLDFSSSPGLSGTGYSESAKQFNAKFFAAY